LYHHIQCIGFGCSASTLPVTYGGRQIQREKRGENFDPAQFQKLSQEPRCRIILDPSLHRTTRGMLAHAFLAHRGDYIATNNAIVY
jgi:hypothetical protein